MSVDDRTLRREDRDWVLSVSDYPAEFPLDGWMGVRLTIKPGNWLRIRQFSKTVEINFGAHAQLVLTHYQARRLCEELASLSVGASDAALSALSGAAPTEPTWAKFPPQFPEAQ